MIGRGKARLALALGVLLAAGAVHAQKSTLSKRRFGIRWVGEIPEVDVSAADFITQDVKKKIQSGLPQTIVVQVLAYKDGKKKPLAAYAHSCRVVFDIWEETYHLEQLTPRERRAVIFADPAQIVKTCLELREVRLGDRSVFRDHRGEKMYIAVSVELNPLSDKALERIRRWLVRPSGSKGLAEDSFYGTFVSLFVNPRIGNAERTLQFRSQAFSVPTRGRTIVP
ncbi:MAG: hypothetical protein H6714_01615 [Myxococcales bacterium]|nr:hypothetical protein [Myxococcales bacterium]